MSNINKKIVETIEKSTYSDEIKELLRTLLAFELKNLSDKNPRYSEDYDRVIMRLAKYRESSEDEDNVTSSEDENNAT